MVTAGLVGLLPGEPAPHLLAALTLLLALAVDRALGDPRSPFHPVALVGRFIGWWGRPALWPPSLQRVGGVCAALCTAALFALPFFVFERFAPWYLYLVAAPFLLKFCFAWRSLEEHAEAVRQALARDDAAARELLARMVSRDTAALSREQILSGAYESASENLVDSIVAPLFYYALFGLPGAAFYRAANTMDAMLGYRDERERLGWFPARLDDALNFVPARLGGLVLLLYFGLRGRFAAARGALRRDARKRPGFNGGIPMAIIAGGAGVCFEKPGVYCMGNPERSLFEGGDGVIRAIRAATLISAGLLAGILVLAGPLAAPPV
ncbi:MAG: adenosylcobinamide-phosphate synthase CbiB [Methanomicrobiales archaeon]|nr:adenosylcobinamide-phosphate synthase CbiB [Methanomicrobiales archaeon]